MAKIISVFNNKGGVGKTSLCWNIADTLGRKGKNVLLIDFDPQCNLSIAVLGDSTFVGALPTQNAPYGTTIRAFLQRFLQNTGGEEIFTHNGPHTHSNVDLIAGDFWLNIYADSLNVGGDLLSGTGLSKYVVLKTIVGRAEQLKSKNYDFVIIDLPPSFGSLVRAAFCSSDYFIVPCTSDNFSVYCVGLIGQMIPGFVKDWQDGLTRFKLTNPHFNDFDLLGKPTFAGWVFNGFDTAKERRTNAEIQAGVPQKDKKMMQADETFHTSLQQAIDNDLVQKLNSEITSYSPTAAGIQSVNKIGDIEDANVLIQNSLWLNVPLGQLHNFRQVKSLNNRTNWAQNQVDQIALLRQKMEELADNIIRTCV
ncbi:AAA family ATPase [Niabella pedocola]|uniref:AAA family ATPase n=1 Tax=Niabella pedocola TaxID=1752077 RepID=A0ABS8PX74_9BACT|nr:AAA family ATPase [Niabella pedocola]MCD2425500.1 AAA family ATPase [Niabella pedocola]